MKESTSLINLEYLKITCGDSEEMVQAIIELFVTSTPDAILELEQHYQDNNPEELRKVAHKVKSSFLTLGAQVTGDKLAQIESDAKSGEINHLGETIAAIKQESASIIQELNQQNSIR